MDLVKRIKAGVWKGTAEYLDVDQGIVGLYGFMPGQKVPPGVPSTVVGEVKALLQRMQKGEFTRFDLFAGPLTDNKGKLLLPAGEKLSQTDLEGIAGCKVCMRWLTQGLVGQVSAAKH